MGLLIKNYKYTYGTLHELRDWALNIVEKQNIKLHCMGKGGKECTCFYCNETKYKTEFFEFINHSDADGGYISLIGLQVVDNKKFREKCTWGNLDKLKKEVEILDKHKKTLPDNLKNAWHDFYTDVKEADRTLIFY